MQEETPLATVIYSVKIAKDIKELRKRYRSITRDIQSFAKQLEFGEITGDRIIGNKYPVFKARIKNSDIQKGKSGGYRVIYYTVIADEILLATVYSKSDQSDTSNQEIEEIIEQELELIESIQLSQSNSILEQAESESEEQTNQKPD